MRRAGVLFFHVRTFGGVVWSVEKKSGSFCVMQRVKRRAQAPGLGVPFSSGGHGVSELCRAYRVRGIPVGGGDKRVCNGWSRISVFAGGTPVVVQMGHIEVPIGSERGIVGMVEFPRLDKGLHLLRQIPTILRHALGVGWLVGGRRAKRAYICRNESKLVEQ